MTETGLDVDSLVLAMQGSDPSEFKLGHDLRIPAARILARLTAAAPALDVSRESFEDAVRLVLSEHIWFDGQQRCACDLWHGVEWIGWREHFVAVLAARLPTLAASR